MSKCCKSYRIKIFAIFISRQEKIEIADSP